MAKYGFSLKRLLGVSSFKSKVARATGIPTTKRGREQKVANMVIKMFKRPFK